MADLFELESAMTNKGEKVFYMTSKRTNLWKIKIMV